MSSAPPARPRPGATRSTFATSSPPSAPAATRGRATTGRTPRRAPCSRVSRPCPSPAPDLASAVAVLGSGAPLERAAALAGIGADDAAGAADALAGVAILEPGSPLTFVHPLIREAIYTHLPQAQRERAHARAAELLRDAGADPEQVATHLVESRGAAPDWSGAALAEAAARAGGRGAPPRAARYLRAAVDGELPATSAEDCSPGSLWPRRRRRKATPVARAGEALDAIEDRVSGPRRRSRSAWPSSTRASRRPRTIFDRGIEAPGLEGTDGDDRARDDAPRLAAGRRHRARDRGPGRPRVDRRAADSAASRHRRSV